jgi:AraC-like DNA-binding protein
MLLENWGLGRQGLRRLRDRTSDYLSDIAVRAAPDDFSFHSATIAVDKAVLIDVRMSAVQIDRTSHHIARGGLDDYQIALCVDGQATYAAGRRNVTMRAGDVCLMDMAQPNLTSVAAHDHSGHPRILSLVLPRQLLGPLLAAPDAAGASLVSRASRQRQLLAEQLLALRHDANAAASGASAAIDAVAGLVADAVGSARSAEDAVGRANRHLLLASIKRYIDANLQSNKVSIEHLCGRFQLSRATIYRLFEPEGGLWRYIQDQRLGRAFWRLASPTSEQTRMIDIAVDFHFSSDTTFVRAFRRRFGVTPGEVKHLAELGENARAAQGSQAPESSVWFRSLAQD